MKVRVNEKVEEVEEVVVVFEGGCGGDMRLGEHEVGWGGVV